MTIPISPAARAAAVKIFERVRGHMDLIAHVDVCPTFGKSAAYQQCRCCVCRGCEGNCSKWRDAEIDAIAAIIICEQYDIPNGPGEPVRRRIQRIMLSSPGGFHLEHEEICTKHNCSYVADLNAYHPKSKEQSMDMAKGVATDPVIFRDELIRNFAALPTGSREFGYGNAASDWDFFAPWEFGVEIRLAQLGFDVSHAHVYHDRGIVGVMTNHTHKIDVILVEDMDIRKTFARYMKAYQLPFLAKLEKHERSDIFCNIINMLISQREQDKNQAQKR